MELEPSRQRELDRVALMLTEFTRKYVFVDTDYTDGSSYRIIITHEDAIAVGVDPNGTITEQTDIDALEELLGDGIDPSLN